MTTKMLIKVLLLGTVMVTFGLIVFKPSSTPKAATDERASNVPTAIELAQPHLDWATAESKKVIDENITPLYEFIHDAKKGTPKFAKEVLSWRSKFKALSPFKLGGDHERFVHGKFEEHIFTSIALQQQIRQIVGNYMKELDNIESQMLVRIRADVPDSQAEYPIAALNNDQLRLKFNDAMDKAIQAVKASGADHVKFLATTVVVEQVLYQVAAQMGISAGIYTISTIPSIATVGLSVVVGVAIDAVVSRVWNWWSNPQEKLTSDINSQLDGMMQLTAKNLRNKLTAAAEERAEVRKAVVLKVLNAN
jgi:hypothetical protein